MNNISITLLLITNATFCISRVKSLNHLIAYLYSSRAEEMVDYQSTVHKSSKNDRT